MHIRNPIEWILQATAAPAAGLGAAAPAEYWPETRAEPQVKRIGLEDLRIALARGYEDFKAHRSDVLMLIVIYPAAALLAAVAIARHDLIPLIFPAVSGLTLVGPLATIWLAELSRRRENHGESTMSQAMDVFRSPQILAIAMFGVIDVLLYIAWIFSAKLIYAVTLGHTIQTSITSFADTLFGTSAGWELMVIGVPAGFLFALAALAMGCVSLPLLLDRNVSLAQAISISVLALRRNPVPILCWGGIVVAGLLLGALPALFGLAVVVPVLGHATWHLYRRIVE